MSLRDFPAHRYIGFASRRTTNVELVSISPLLTAASIEAARSAMQRIARGLVPALADFSLIFLADAIAIQCVAGAHATADGARLVRMVMRSYRIRRRDPSSTVAHVIRTSQPLLRSDIHIDPSPRRDAVSELHRRLAPCSALAVPIDFSGSVVGALSVCYSQSGRSYAGADVAAVTHAASRIAEALSRARAADATLRLRPSTRDTRQGTTIRRRVAPRD
jgi:GAF domain-containing protein